MDGIYIKIKDKWEYLYGAIVTEGHTIEHLLTARWHSAAVLRLFHKAVRLQGEPEVATIDKRGANTTALAMINADKPDEETINIRQSLYLNYLLEQGHRTIKRRIHPMLSINWSPLKDLFRLAI